MPFDDGIPTLSNSGGSSVFSDAWRATLNFQLAFLATWACSIHFWYELVVVVDEVVVCCLFWVVVAFIISVLTCALTVNDGSSSPTLEQCISTPKPRRGKSSQICLYSDSLLLWNSKNYINTYTPTSFSG